MLEVVARRALRERPEPGTEQELRSARRPAGAKVSTPARPNETTTTARRTAARLARRCVRAKSSRGVRTGEKRGNWVRTSDLECVRAVLEEQRRRRGRGRARRPRAAAAARGRARRGGRAGGGRAIERVGSGRGNPRVVKPALNLSASLARARGPSLPHGVHEAWCLSSLRSRAVKARALEMRAATQGLGRSSAQEPQAFARPRRARRKNRS